MVMKRKRVHGKRRGQRRGKRRGRGMQKGFKSRIPNLLSNVISNKRLMPDRFRTKCTTEWLFSLVGATLTSTFNYFLLDFNTPLQPLDLPPFAGQPTGRLNAATFNYMSGFTVDTQAVGISQLLGLPATSIYNKFRVFASKCSVRVQGNNVNDQPSICIAPVYLSINNLDGTSLYSSSQGMMQALNGSAMRVNSINPNKFDNSVSKYITTAKVIGLDRRSILSPQYSGSVIVGTITPPNQRVLWQVSVEDNLQSAFAGVIGFKVRLTHWVEFFDQNESIAQPILSVDGATGSTGP